MRREWGRLPEEVRAELEGREWHNSRRLRERLTGQRPFPVSVSLRPPSGGKALDDLAHFHAYVEAWKNHPKSEQVDWEARQYRQLSSCQVPVRLRLANIQALLEFLGAEAIARSHRWEALMAPLLALDEQLYSTLVGRLGVLEQMTTEDTVRLAALVPQLTRGMGRGAYLRALPIRGVDTKFVETHAELIAGILDILTSGDVSATPGLLAWLGCRDLPRGWLHVRPLCTGTRERLGNLPLMQISTDVLVEQPLPGRRVLVVENKQSGFALPALPDTVAVFGGGRNTAWMAASWLRQRSVGYWGDLDSWGFACLSEARTHQPNLEALMMDRDTLLQHRHQMIDEDVHFDGDLLVLTTPERQLFEELRSGVYHHTRLEQERLLPEFVTSALLEWVSHTE